MCQRASPRLDDTGRRTSGDGYNPNPNTGCNLNTAQFAPGNGQDIVVPPGFKVSVFASGLNLPDGNCLSQERCRVRGLCARIGARAAEQHATNKARCRGEPSLTNNPFTPDILVFDQNGHKIRGPLGKPTATGGGLQPAGPAVDIAFEKGLKAAACSRPTRTRRPTRRTKQQLADRDRGSR